MDRNIEVLEEILDLLEEERKKFYNLVNQNDFRIEEINSYLRELSKKEDDDFKVFSPRNVENMHWDQIEADNSEKKKYEEENVKYNKKIGSLKVLIDKLNIVIGNLQIYKETQEQQGLEQSKCEILDERSIVSDVDNEVDFVKNSVDNLMDGNKDDSINELEEKVLISEDQINYNKYLYIKNLEEDDYIERKHIAHQILNCVSFITSDAERAKIELTALAKKIAEY